MATQPKGLEVFTPKNEFEASALLLAAGEREAMRRALEAERADELAPLEADIAEINRRYDRKTKQIEKATIRAMRALWRWYRGNVPNDSRTITLPAGELGMQLSPWAIQYDEGADKKAVLKAVHAAFPGLVSADVTITYTLKREAAIEARERLNRRSLGVRVVRTDSVVGRPIALRDAEKAAERSLRVEVRKITK